MITTALHELERTGKKTALISMCCGGGGGSSVAANGGTSGTGISQGSISSFGSIFVNGVEWNLSGTTIEIDGTPGSESDLRVGMVVRVEGDFAASGLTGTANRVTFDDEIEGPIASAPVETVPGLVREFSVLGQTVRIHADSTAFDDGATFAGLAADDVVEVSGFVDASGAIDATRVELKGQLPIVNEVELRGTVANLVSNANSTGIFDLGSVVVRYDSTTVFSDTSRLLLANGDFVEVEGTLRVTGNEIDASEIELEIEGFGDANADDVEIEGIVQSCPQAPSFCVGSVPVDASGASFDPIGFMPAPGDLVEVEGSLANGVVIAQTVESEDEDEANEDVKIEAAVTSVDAAARALVILGVTVSADGETTIEDDSNADDENFEFGEIQVGNFLEIDGIATGGATVRALSIERDDANDDVRLEGPVTQLDTVTPGLEVLGQTIPLDAGTLYFNALDQPRTEDQFFRNPGDVMLGDVVQVKDENAANLSQLTEADEVELEID